MKMLANNSHNGTFCYYNYDSINSWNLQFEPETENSLNPDAKSIENGFTMVPQNFFDMPCKHTHDSSNTDLHLFCYPVIAPLSPSETSVESLLSYPLDTPSPIDVSQTVLSSPDACLPFFISSPLDIYDSELKLDPFIDNLTYCSTQMSSSLSPRSLSPSLSTSSSLSPPPMCSYFPYTTNSVMSSNTQEHLEQQNNEEKRKVNLPKTEDKLAGGDNNSCSNFISPFEENYLQAINRISAKSKKIKSNIKPFVCVVCARPFARKHDLQRHTRVHTGVKPYSCLHCKKAFIRTDALKHHLRVVEACRMSPIIQAMKKSGDRRYKNL